MRLTTLFAATALALSGASATAALAKDADLYTVTGRIAGADGGWDYASVDPDGSRLYVARSNAVMAVDLPSRKVTNALASANGAHAVLAIDGGKTLVETDGRSDQTRFIDAKTGAVIAAVATAGKPDGVAFDPLSQRLIVLAPHTDTLYLIDPATHKVTGTAVIKGGLEGVVVDSHGNAYMNLEDAAGLVKFAIATGKVVFTVPLKGCEGPTGIGLVEGETRVITACASGAAVVTDTATGTVRATLAIDKGADYLFVDAGRHRALIPCGTSGTLVTLDTRDSANITVAGRTATQVGARTGAIDPRDGTIYLPVARFTPPPPGQRRGQAVPGSFEVLVLSPSA